MAICPRRILVGLTVAMISLAGCTQEPDSSESQHSSPSSTTPVQPTTSVPSPTTTASPSPFDVLAYQAEPQRVARINDAMQRFGTIVLEQSRTPGSPWGPFDTYCSHDTEDGRPGGEGGYTSQGYVPAPGDECSVAHVPQYGGPAIQVSADVTVGADGQYAIRIIGAWVTTPACHVDVRYADDTKVPLIGVGPGTDYQSPSMATSLEEAQALDDQAVACLDSTRP